MHILAPTHDWPCNVPSAARLAKQDITAKPMMAARKKIIPRKTQKIGTPGYKVVKQRDANTQQLSLLFRVHYPSIEKGLQPRHRFMSTFEQNIEQKDKRWQYILFAAEPYDTVAFKIPNRPIDKDANKLFTHWNEDTKDFTFQMHFEREAPNGYPYRNIPQNLNLDD